MIIKEVTQSQDLIDCILKHLVKEITAAFTDMQLQASLLIHLNSELVQTGKLMDFF